MPGFGGNTVRAYLTTQTGASWRDWANVQGYLGSWRQASDVYVRDNGTWKKVWIRLVGPTSVTVSGTSTSLSRTLSWSGAVGAEGYKIYRNGSLVSTITNGASTSTAITLPDFEVDYTYSVSAYFASVETATTSASPARATLPAPTLSGSLARGYTYSNNNPASADYYATVGHTTPDFPVTTKSPQISLSWTAIPGVASYEILKGGAVHATTTNTSYIDSSATSATYTVRGKSGGGVAGPVSNSRTLTVGSARTRGFTSGVSSGDAQSSFSGTTNGQFNVVFTGSVFNTWVYQVKWTLTVTSFVTSEITNYPGRKIQLTYPGGPFEVPDGRPLGWDKTIAIVGQNVTVGVDPYGSSWSSSGTGTIGTFHVDATIRIYYSAVTAVEVAPSVS